MPCRRLTGRREATIARGRVTGAAAAGPPKVLSTAYTACDASKTIETAANPVLRRSAPRKLHDQLPHDDFAQKFDRYTPVAAARVRRRGGASPSKRRLEPYHPSCYRSKQSTASRGAPGRTRAIARLGRCPWLFVDPFAGFFLEPTTPFLDKKQSF